MTTNEIGGTVVVGYLLIAFLVCLLGIYMCGREGISTRDMEPFDSTWESVVWLSLVWPLLLLFPVVMGMHSLILYVNRRGRDIHQINRERELEEAKKEPAPVKARPLERVDPHW